MTKAELIKAISEKTSNLNKKQIESIIDSFVSVVKDALKKDETIVLKGFATFKNKQRRERKAKNPQTGEVITIPAKKVPACVISKNFYD